VNRIIFITENIVSTSGEDTRENSLIGRVAAQIIELNSMSTEDPIYVVIDTDGGNLKTALSLFDILRSSIAPVHTLGLSEVSSAGVLIFLAGDKRIAFPRTQFMTHPSTLNVTGSSLDFKTTSETLSSQGEIVKDLFKDRANISKKKFEKLHSKVNFMWADRAKKEGIVTQIEHKLPIELIQHKTDKNFAEAAMHLQGLAEIIGMMQQ